MKSGSVRQLERSTGIQCSFPGGLLITFVKQRQSPKTFRAARLFSCLCFYDFPKRTAPKIHKIWHLVNLINVLQPFAKKDENSKKDGWCFPPGSLWDLDGPICRTWMLYAGSVLSFSVTIRIPPPCPSWGWAVIWWGCSPYPAHLHPNKNIWQDWHPTPARAYSHNPWRCSRNFFEGICWEMLTSGFEGCFGRLFIKSRCSANVERIWSTPEATALPPALAFRETN